MEVMMVSLWAGRIAAALAVLFLIFDAVIKLMVITPVVDSFARLGVPAHLPVVIGVLELTLLVLYLVPVTSVLGAILLTGFLGGATMLHVRVGDPLLSHILFPSYIGLLLWAGLWFRDRRLRELIPVRRETAATS
jgi:hypothetical protein